MSDEKKVILVGAGTSLSRAIAERLVDAGCERVVVVDSRTPPMVEPSFQGTTKQERRKGDQWHWKNARRHAKK